MARIFIEYNSKPSKLIQTCLIVSIEFFLETRLKVNETSLYREELKLATSKPYLRTITDSRIAAILTSLTLGQLF